MKSGNTTILVVDDEPELLEIFAIWMSREGYTVLTAANGAEALKVLTSTKVDALISDIRMPVMDGLTLVRRIYEMKLQLPSIIFVSGFGDVNPREAHALGVEAMLPKPLGRKHLLNVLEASLKERESLWLEPTEEIATDTLATEFSSLKLSEEACEFQVGRGGVCFRYSRALPEDALVKLSIAFTEEQLRLNGQGRVRWSAAKDERVGVEFVYVAPESREWVLARMDENPVYSFIPSCG
jgi:CheY-like chemotaxis protein